MPYSVLTACLLACLLGYNLNHIIFIFQAESCTLKLLEEKKKSAFFKEFSSVNQKLENALSKLLLIKDAIYSLDEQGSDCKYYLKSINALEYKVSTGGIGNSKWWLAFETVNIKIEGKGKELRVEFQGNAARKSNGSLAYSCIRVWD